MTITCPNCGFSAAIDSTRIPATGTTASCPRCPCRFPVHPPAPARSERAEPLLVLCPACREEQSFTPECSRCGIIFARYRPAGTRRTQPPPIQAEKTRPWQLRRALAPIGVVLGLLLLWILFKDLIPTTLTTAHETLGVTSGFMHSVAVRSDGTVWAWGDNTYGQLGNGRRGGMVAAPRKVAGIGDVVAVAAGDRHTLALKKDGTVWAWGDNESCQLGDVSGIVLRTEPVQVTGLDGITAIGAGRVFSVALKRDGTLWYFGDGFIGGGGMGDRAKPHRIDGIGDVVAVSCGRTSIAALRSNGSVWCWGESSQGQMGNDFFGIRWDPAEVAGLDNVVAVAAGEQFTLALKKDGTVWGLGSLHIAKGTNLQRQGKPVQIPGLTGIRDIKAGYWLALALKKDGTIWHSGEKSAAAPGEQRGIADILKRKKTAGVGAIFAGGRDAFLEKSDGTLLCWGVHDYGNPVKKGEKREISLAALAFEPFSGDKTPSAGNEVQGEQTGLRFKAIAAGSKHSLALAEDGTVWAWGENEAGQVTDKAVGSANAPRQVADREGRTLEEVTAIAAGTNTSLAVRRDGSLWLWGQNLSRDEYISPGRSGSNGVWGGGPHNNIPLTRIEGVRDALSVAGGNGGRRFVVLHDDGRLSTFGVFDKETSPLLVRPLPGVSDVVALSGGGKHFAALKRDGTVWTWGGNDSGQLGNGTNTPNDTPRRVKGIADVVSLAAGNNVTLAVTKDGTVWGWGRNVYGVSTAGLDVTSSHSPMKIAGLKNIVSVAVPGNGFLDSNHYLAADRDGRVFTWGFNSHGQLGQGTKGHTMVRRPAMIEGLNSVTAVTAGLTHSLVLRSDGTIRSWGGNSSGQLGIASGLDSAFPTSTASAGGDGGEKKP